MLNEYFEATSKITDQYGGVVPHCHGDLMLIIFNAALLIKIMCRTLLIQLLNCVDYGKLSYFPRRKLTNSVWCEYW